MFSGAVMELQQLSLLEPSNRMLVSASPIVIEGLRALGCEIVASTGFAAQLPHLAARFLPDLTLLHSDGRRRDDVLAPLARLRSCTPEMRLVLMLPVWSASVWREELDRLACEVVAHDCDAYTLRLVLGVEPPVPKVALTARELAVLRCVAEGLTNRAIGSRLALSEYTVKNYLKRIHEKLGVHSRTQAVTAAARAGHPVMPGR